MSHDKVCIMYSVLKLQSKLWRTLPAMQRLSYTQAHTMCIIL